MEQQSTQKIIRAVTVYAGSADGVSDVYYQAAFDLGRTLAERGLRLVYGAGKTGMMGAAAEGALQNGGQVTGVVNTYLNLPHLIHANLSALEVVENMHQRKARMSELADAFIALPGGYGTFEELFEMLAWAQLGLHNKPIGVLNTNHYFDPLLDLVQHALKEGFIYKEHPTLLLASDDPRALIDSLTRYAPPENLNRWINRDA